jgi:hypothetical protein
MKRFVTYLGLLWATAIFILFMMFFLLAVANGGSMTLVLTAFNEVMLEYVIITLIVWPITSIAMFYAIESVDDDEEG